jgi:hypothetical protein
MSVTTRLIAALCVLLVSTSFVVHAEQSQSFGEYVIHYNAFATGDLSPEIAKAYGITRSKNRALLNVTVLKKMLSTTGRPVTATVKSNVANMNRQLQMLDTREVRESNAIYYLAEVNVNDQDTLEFNIDVTPTGHDQTAHIQFRQQFFTR